MIDSHALFAADTRLMDGATRVDVGRVHVATGRLFCCDPFLSSDCGELDRRVVPGEFLASLSLAHIEGWGKRVACAALFVTQAPVVAWEKATYRREGKTVWRFPVDAGLACFMDASTERLFHYAVNEFHREHPQGNYYDDVLASGFQGNARVPGHSGDWFLHFPVPGDPSNVALFASGVGDGEYPVFWGLDEHQQPCRLIVDFGITG